MATRFDPRALAGPDAPRNAGGRSRRLLTRLLRGTAGTGVFLLGWWYAARSQPSYLLPSPVEVGGALVTEAATGRLFVHLRQSLVHYVPGVVAGVVCGSLLGIAMGWSRRVDDLLTPVVRVLRPIPPLAWTVFAVVWIGLGHAGAAFIVFIGALWITFYNAYEGVESASDELIEVAATLGVETDRRMVRRVVLPEALPSVLTGVRTSVGQCWMMVIAAELFGAPGIGYEILTSANNLAMQRSVAYMLVISAVFLVSDWGVRRARNGLLRWA